MSIINAKHFGLTFKYLLHLVVVGIILSLLIVWNASYRQQITVMNEMEQRGALLGESLASVCSLRYLLGDLDSIRYILSKANEIQDVRRIVLFDRRKDAVMVIGEVVGDMESDPHFQTLNPDQTTAWRKGGFIHVLAPLTLQRQKKAEIADMLSDKAGPNQDVSQKELHGYIYIALSLDRTQQFLKTLILRSVIATIAIIFLGSAVAFIFFRKTILKPLHRLVEAMLAVQRGNFELNLQDVNRQDEIGTLTRAFNEMTCDLHRAEMDLKAANSGLEKKILERTKDLENALQELKETQDRVIRSEKLAAIGQLASGVGHELRNPLGAIKNALYYIKNSLEGAQILREDPTLDEFLQLSENEIESASRIISDLLDFSRVPKLMLQAADIHHVLDYVKKALKAPENIKRVEHYAKDLPKVSIDVQRLHQVFVNLSTNAFQAMPGGGELTIRTGLDGRPGDSKSFVKVEFEDTGEGISPENMGKLFEPLFTTKAKGTGLGLAICKGILEVHGGGISVESERGKGSKFTVSLPLAQA